MKILIIEDDILIRKNLADMLDLNGHTVIEACDGREGVEHCRTAPAPDFIISDINMPVMDGFTAMQAIQALPGCEQIPYVFLTAVSDRAGQRRGMALGADDYITKPFTEREILEAIEARTRRQRPLRERLKGMLEREEAQLSAQWSHELLTPLNGVMGGLELIEAEADNISKEELRGLLAVIRESAERQYTLARKLIMYFKLEYEKERPQHPAPCHAGLIVPAAATRAAGACGRAADLHLRFDDAELPLHSDILHAAVYEVVENAFRFSTTGTAVHVDAKRAQAHYEIHVTDEGCGMTPEQCEEASAFRQYNRDRTNQQGLGLGVAIAKNAMSIAGGSFSLLPAPSGRGLRAILRCPCSPKDEGGPQA